MALPVLLRGRPQGLATRRTWATIALCATTVIASAAFIGSPAAAGEPIQHVDPFIGTALSNAASDAPGGGHSGNVFPGPSVPFGMVQFSPDTDKAETSGYAYEGTQIEGFSLTHREGVGCVVGEDLPLLPTVGNGNQASPHFQHSDEQASPGYYRVGLDNGVNAELTATNRGGLARFTYPSTSDANVIFDVGHSKVPGGAAESNVVSDDTVNGFVETGQFCGEPVTHRLYFTAHFNRPFQATDVGNNRLILHFDAADNRTVEAQVGVSYVNVDGANANLNAEVGGTSFDDIHRRAVDAWKDRLGVVNLDGGSDADRTKFYTALYHSFLGPTTANDVNGNYLGMDNIVHDASGTAHYTTISGWDIFRSQVQELSMLAPDVARDLARSLVADGQQCGTMPRWADANNETGIQVGDPASLIVSSINAFRITDFDRGAALALMRKSGEEVGAACGRYESRPGLAPYLAKGYLPVGTQTSWFEPHHGVTAVTLEYADADFAIGQFAQTLGDGDTANTYARRAENWRNVFDSSVGYVRGRNDDGTFAGDFSPTTTEFMVEGNAAQYTFTVNYNLAGLGDALGGDGAAIARLDSLFTELNGGLHNPTYYAGNEPEFSQPWAYDAYGAAYRTQDVVSRIRSEVFGTGPGDLPGNDDLGATSSYYVLAALGIFPATPGTDLLSINSPLFPKATLRLPGGELRITANGTGSGPYIQDLSVNGQHSDRAFVHYSELANGGDLNFQLGGNPNTSFGSGDGNRTPSFG